MFKASRCNSPQADPAKKQFFFLIHIVALILPCYNSPFTAMVPEFAACLPILGHFESEMISSRNYLTVQCHAGHVQRNSIQESFQSPGTMYNGWRWFYCRCERSMRNDKAIDVILIDYTAVVFKEIRDAHGLQNKPTIFRTQNADLPAQLIAFSFLLVLHVVHIALVYTLLGWWSMFYRTILSRNFNAKMSRVFLSKWHKFAHPFN